MAKYFGKIGYAATKEVKPGVWEPQIVEREYFGDVTRIINRNQSTDKVNDNIVVSNAISIVADPFANENFSTIVYAEYMGVLWKVSSVEVQFPRLILSIGEVYNVDN